MSEVEEVKRRRRSRQLTHGTLRRGLSRERISAGAQGTVKGLVAVEVADGDTAGRPKAREGRCGLELEVILAKVSLPRHAIYAELFKHPLRRMAGGHTSFIDTSFI
jgi:hypothetical protein